jgi:hypothetical protein
MPFFRFFYYSEKMGCGFTDGLMVYGARKKAILRQQYRLGLINF